MTNGEKIEEIFPNLETIPNPYSPSIDIGVGGIMMMRVDRNWWNAEYKEPFINKPCVSSEVCEHDKNKVLDKIREEIKVMTSNRGFLSCSVDYIHEEIDNVFDKYKAESEGQAN